MTAPEVDPAAVEVAAESLCDAHYGSGCWANTRRGGERHGIFWRRAEVALTAAYPVLREGIAAEVLAAWHDEGRAVMFNKAGADLSPEQRVGKWLTAALSTAKEATT